MPKTKKVESPDHAAAPVLYGAAVGVPSTIKIAPEISC